MKTEPHQDLQRTTMAATSMLRHVVVVTTCEALRALLTDRGRCAEML